ncbi:hypothetical protein Tsubulata_028751 [Turnera subulata]|uniref:Glycoside hydrolase family 3 N-terminal domain-containing protein n=1 Tax=Turnera subulata TaxID=218843 RepID=A0A9Q0FRN1_9ROSI|nr:hypothetical protein Tsubulata_028751 [Turnera subulata]
MARVLGALWWLTVVLVWTVTVGGGAEVEYVKYKVAVKGRIQDLMSRMSLEEKISQMAQIDRLTATPEWQSSVLSDGGSAPLPEASAEDWSIVYAVWQEALLLLYMLWTHRDPDLVERIGSATAIEVRATGIPYVIAPCVADHKVVESMTEIILGLQVDTPPDYRKGVPFIGRRDKVAVCAKHFVGDGGTTKGINKNNTLIDRHGLLSMHIPAYSDSVIKGVSTIMVSSSSWNGEKMHANRELITGFLKDTLKFKGFVISDWQGLLHHHIQTTHALCMLQLKHGLICLAAAVMLPFNHTEFIDDLTYLVKNNVIPMGRIDDAVERILLVKFSLGLFEKPLADLSLVIELGSQRFGNKSLVLLKNGKNGTDPLLPLPKKASKILVSGTHADNLGYQCGGDSMATTTQELFYNELGFHSLNRFCLETTYSSSFIYFIPLIGTTILDVIKSAVDPKMEIIFQEVPDTKFVKSNNFAYAIVVVGEPPYAESAGDSEDLTMKDPGPSVISNVCGTVKCVVVIISGRPIVIEPYVSSIDALLAANWLPGTEGQGVTYVLFGDYGFTGKLPRTWFKTVDQLPMNVGDAHYDPLFPFDFGLTTKSGPKHSGKVNICCCFRSTICAYGRCFYHSRIVKSNLGSYEPEATREPEKPLEIDGSRVLDDMRRAPLGFC